MTRIIFFGTSIFAIPALDALRSDGYDIESVITQPDRPVGRAQAMEPPPVKIKAQKLGISVIQPESLKAVELPPADVGIVAAYGKIIPKSAIAHFPKGILNIHPSLLPQYRGPTPLQTAIANGDRETGVTIILLDEEMDHGPILAQENVMIDPQETFPSLEEKTARVGAELLLHALKEYLSGAVTAREQNHSVATYTKILTRDDGRINWSESAEAIERKLRAYTPWPGIWTMWNGKRIKIIAAQAQLNLPLPSRERVGVRGASERGLIIADSGRIFVSCAKGALEITILQPESARPMSAKEFLAGYARIIGSRFE